LREQGIEPEVCDLINAKATDIYTACAFQDLTGQGTGKVIHLLRYLEGRINAMIDIWGLEDEAAGEKAAGPNAPAALTGPPGLGLDQADVDVMMAPTDASTAEVFSTALPPSSSRQRSSKSPADSPVSSPASEQRCPWLPVQRKTPPIALAGVSVSAACRHAYTHGKLDCRLDAQAFPLSALLETQFARAPNRKMPT